MIIIVNPNHRMRFINLKLKNLPVMCETNTCRGGHRAWLELYSAVEPIPDVLVSIKVSSEGVTSF